MTNRNQATLFPAKELESNTLTIFCSGCGIRPFKVDEDTLSNAGIVSLKCPDCGAGTSLSLGPTGNVLIVPGLAQDYFHPKKKTRKPKGVVNESQ